MDSTRPAMPELLRALDEYSRSRLRVRRYRYLEQAHAPRVASETPELRTPDGPPGEATGDGSYTISGHAAVTGQTTVLADMGWLRISERLAPGAFDTVLAAAPDVHLNINHDMRYVMARTGRQGIGGLELAMDHVGLRDYAKVSPDISFVRDLAVQMKSGLIDQQSFAFMIGDETRTEVDDGDVVDVMYEINEVSDLFDVCVCAQGAYPQTDASLRGLVMAASRASLDLAGSTDHRDADASGGQIDDIAPLAGVGSSRVLLARAKARARTTRANLTLEHS